MPVDAARNPPAGTFDAIHVIASRYRTVVSCWLCSQALPPESLWLCSKPIRAGLATSLYLGHHVAFASDLSGRASHLINFPTPLMQSLEFRPLCPSLSANTETRRPVPPPQDGRRGRPYTAKPPLGKLGCHAKPPPDSGLAPLGTLTLTRLFHYPKCSRCKGRKVCVTCSETPSVICALTSSALGVRRFAAAVPYLGVSGVNPLTWNVSIPSVSKDGPPLDRY